VNAVLLYIIQENARFRCVRNARKFTLKSIKRPKSSL
jgi:hypothetical protein